MRIFILTPILTRQGTERRHLPLPVAPDVELEYRGLDKGSATVEFCYDEYVGVMDMVEKGIKAQSEGFDAVVINCAMNPAMEGLRELLDIPVVGAGLAVVHVASMLGDTFSIIDTGQQHWPYLRRVVASAGLLNKLASVRALNLTVSELSGEPDTVSNRIVEEAIKAVEKDGAHVIVFGCTGMRRYAERLADEMKKYGVPVVEPLSAAVNVAEILVRLKLVQSKVSYPRPLEKKRTT
jgi:allantoin racemase